MDKSNYEEGMAIRMKSNKWEQELYGSNVRVITRENNGAIYRVENEAGKAVITRYEIYQGIALVYNDVHTSKIRIDNKLEQHQILEVNHCREGQIEFETSDGEFIYIKKGDMVINTKSGVKRYSNFPQAHYHGVTIEIDLDALQRMPLKVLEELQLDIEGMKYAFCKKERCFVLHEKEEFEHLFAELYRVPDQIRERYYKLKVMEILLFLSAIDVTNEQIENRYFNKEIVASVKEIHEYMLLHLEEKITIDLLAEKFKIAATSLKKCFKEVYGNSIYAYLKEQRIQKATELLKNSNIEIGRIAGMVGYDNASKFSSSFKSVMGINPREYRKSV